ncbi:Hypothetical predicted protein [Mytilus galloprovincialis]|uniref:Ig-like domain-containing protein n=1 Tax=Mytilus galloprovincialis TaxID=29158 RepID=A0A8B6E015_MYTGA|nr:Hypothetical predicted protein [Mytilus galloprovincialis]
MKILYQFGIFWFCFDSAILARVNPRVKFLYHSEGETVFLKCKSIVNRADWVGPAQQNKSGISWVMETDIFGRLRKWNISLFTSGEKVNPSLPHKNKLKIVYNKETGDTILRIRNFSQSDEGLYICHSSPLNGSLSSVRFILQQKNKEVEFIKVFPSTTIILRYNYTAITVDWTGPNHDNNRFISEEIETDTHSIKAKWNVTTYTNNGYFNPVLPHKKRLKIVGDPMRGQFFLQIEDVSYNDADRPSVRLVYRNYTQHDVKRTIGCKADGQPMNYIYRKWEHKSMFNEHIRYLTELGTGILTLPFLEIQNRYQDSGIYVCRVSNGVPDTKGIYYTTGRAHVFSQDEKQLSSHDITIKVLLGVIAVLVVGMGICFWNRYSHSIAETRKNGNVVKQRYRKRIITTLNMPAPEENDDESAHYMEIIDDNILTTSQENNNPIISTADINVVEIRNTDLILEESSLASSDNSNNASEHVDDGYEKPYTTLLVLNPVEITHDYLTTKRKYSNENPAIFATDAFGTTSMYETKPLHHPNARYENVNLKSDENKAEYINLSLKQ